MASRTVAAAAPLLLQLLQLGLTDAWRVCDITHQPYGAVGNGIVNDTVALRTALAECDQVYLPAQGTFLTAPLNLTSNQVLEVDGTLLASAESSDYNLVLPLMGYGWGNDENCFGPGTSPYKIHVGSLRYTPVIGAFHAKNVTITGSGAIDGQGQTWWTNCTMCHYPPHNDSSRCEIASRPKLIETQFVDGLRVVGSSPGSPLTLRNSPFWTLTPSYSQNIYIANLNISDPIDLIGNTDGVNLDSCRNALVENILIKNVRMCTTCTCLSFALHAAHAHSLSLSLALSLSPRATTACALNRDSTASALIWEFLQKMS